MRRRGGGDGGRSEHIREGASRLRPDGATEKAEVEAQSATARRRRSIIL